MSQKVSWSFDSCSIVDRFSAVLPEPRYRHCIVDISVGVGHHGWLFSAFYPVVDISMILSFSKENVCIFLIRSEIYTHL